MLEPSPGEIRVDRRVGVVMAFVAATLVVASVIHLAGLTPAGTKAPFAAGRAGIAEAIIAVALAWGAIVVLRSAPHARTVAVVTTSFAIVGFLIGLSMTSRGGDTADVAYHVVTLPVLVAVLVALLRTPSKDLGPGGPS
ncbi:MAG TPA: hypothetical protein VGH66_10665 [Acidimicrobiales bacterium]|jgi:hypothetical protein